MTKRPVGVPRSLPKRPIDRPPVPIGRSDRRLGLKITTLMNNNRSSMFANRFKTAIETAVRAKNVGNSGNYYRFCTTETKFPTEAELHRQVVLKMQPDLPWSQTRVACTCDCSDFTFRFEYALAQRGAAVGPPSSNMEFPEKTNPELVPAVCKHLLMVFKELLKQ